MTVAGGAPQRRGHPDGSSDLTVAEQFVVIWNTLADVLGTAATAALLRRAVKRAAARGPLDPLAIERQGLSYGFTVPEGWREARDGQALESLRRVMRELHPLLVELTGSVVIRRLERVDALSSLGVGSPDEQPLGGAPS